MSKNAAGTAKAAKLRADMKRYQAGHRATKVAELIAINDSSARAELRKMRDVYYSTDKATTPGHYFNPKGKHFARGSEGKARNILKGHNARKSQAKGL
ncbi:hypothetical protein AIIMSPaA1_046 [Pseudomonas phage AIIMS-Pa-A1]|uniref:Uncharacterized protein n=2 Tax=Phikmvvirus TaxID=477967 RepID=A0AAE9YB41_9CAUD|nr:hypothetical protein AIIMSPaA1_046 [Pseudomonas phage AIIMS-Pa-A1]WCS66237.1 hypothetical protein vBPaePP1G_007 [Pseudomonas phage vB_PaeP_P1G]